MSSNGLRVSRLVPHLILPLSLAACATDKHYCSEALRCDGGAALSNKTASHTDDSDAAFPHSGDASASKTATPGNGFEGTIRSSEGLGTTDNSSPAYGEPLDAQASIAVLDASEAIESEPDSDEGSRDQPTRKSDASVSDSLDADIEGGVALDASSGNLCQVDNGGCEGQCSRTEDVPSCSCDAPAALAADEHRCLEWNDPVLLENDDRGYAVLPKLATDALGNTMAIWEQPDGTKTNVWAERYVVGTGWSAPSLLALGESEGEIGSSALAVASGGETVATWIQGDGVSGSLWANRFLPGSAWQGAELLAADDGGCMASSVGIDDHGNAVTVWTQSDGTRRDVWTVRYTLASGWGTPELLEEDATNANDAFVSMNAEGEAFAVWEQAGDVWGARYDQGSGWSSAFTIETESGSVHGPMVAVDGSGNAIAIWTQDGDDRADVWANRYAVGTGWGIATEIESDDSNPTLPNLVIDANGTAFVAWLDSSDNYTDKSIWANRFVAGSGWEKATELGVVETTDPTKPGLAVNAQGEALAVWTSPNVTSARYVIGDGWSSPTLLEDAARDVAAAVVTMDASGNATAAWEQQGKTQAGKKSYDLFASRFE